MRQLEEELTERSDILLEAQDEYARRTMVSEAGNYVLTVESVPLTHEERLSLFDDVYSQAFGFGPLDQFVEDDEITELMIDGYDRIHVRRNMGEPEPAEAHFEDADHLAMIIERILTGAGGQLLDNEPFVEVGLIMKGRPARLSVVGPPLNPVLHADFRLHRFSPAALDEMVLRGVMTEIDRVVIGAIARSQHGILIAGEVAAGKTTLLESLIPLLAQPEHCWLVERAAEVRLPEGFHRLQALPASAGSSGVEFPAQIAAALDEAPGTLILDELRGDESVEIWQALAQEAGPRCWFVLRSSPDPDRLRNALNILIRKGQQSLPQEAINAVLTRRLPFVITTHIDRTGMHVRGVSEWRMGEEGRLTLVPLVQQGTVTGNVPFNRLELPGDLWTGDAPGS